jgi:ribosomal protein S18 acetylase RimI-like enzyme
MLLARRSGQPVATALAVVDGDAVVIYNVATLPEARGRGIGAAITLAALRDARSGGATLGVLESSEIGYGVYRRIGFREAGRFRILVRRRRPSVGPA